MGRARPLVSLLGAPAICNVCNRRCQGLHQAGAICYWCFEGRFVHREFWKRGWCHACGGTKHDCPYCFGTGDTYTPKQDVTEQDLIAWSASLGLDWP